MNADDAERERENEAESIFEKLTKDSPKLVKDCIPTDKQNKHKEHQTHPFPILPSFILQQDPL